MRHQTKPTIGGTLFISGIVAAALLTHVPLAVAKDHLPSWNEGAAKKAIMRYVTEVTRSGSSDYIVPSQRIATFDNDGTLWLELPLDVKIAFALDGVKTLAPHHPEWATAEPLASLLKGDVEATLSGGEATIFRIITATHAGMTTEEFEKVVRDWLATATHPKTGKRYIDMVYQPMLEVLLKLPDIDFIDDKDTKRVGIQTHIGRRPISAFGNSDGDMEMLQGPAEAQPRTFVSTSITQTPSENGVTTASLPPANWIGGSTRPSRRVGLLST